MKNCFGNLLKVSKPIPADYLMNHLNQGSPNFFVRGPHKPIQNMSRAGRLTQCDCCRMRYILPNLKIFRKYCILFFHHWLNSFAGRISPAGRSLEALSFNSSFVCSCVFLRSFIIIWWKQKQSTGRCAFHNGTNFVFSLTQGCSVSVTSSHLFPCFHWILHWCWFKTESEVVLKIVILLAHVHTLF